MLLQFSVENYMSFRDRATFSLVPDATSDLPYNIVESGNLRALKSAVVFGANASGKTNLIRAIAAAVLTIRESEAIQLGAGLSRIVPFKLDSDSHLSPTSFEFIFVVGQTKYIYGFSATNTEIVEEYLYAYYTGRPTTIFERAGDDYVFKADKKQLEALAIKNNRNRLFLATMAAWNYQRAKDPFLWFAKSIDSYAGSKWRRDYSAFVEDSSGEQKEFTIRLLEIADINISDFDVQQVDTPLTLSNRPDFLVSMAHRVGAKEGEAPYTLDLMSESAGTQNLFFMSTHLMRAFKSGKTLIVDELDAGLHPLLLEEIVRMFHDPDINHGNAQLIFATHDVNLLDLSLFRRDQIYFTEKESRTATSALFSLDEFSVRRKESVRNGYLNGRYGALPNIRQGGSPWA